MARGTVDKWKSKRWVEVLAPKMFNSRSIGHTVTSDMKKIVGRRLNVNMNEVTGGHNPRQKIMLKFKVEKMQDDKAITKFLGHVIPQTNMRNAARKKNTKTYVNKTVKTRDNKEFVVKSILVTDRSAARSIRTAIAKKYEEVLLHEAGKAKFSTFISDVLGNSFAITAKKELHKIYPVRQIIVEKTEISDKVELPDEPVARERNRGSRENRTHYGVQERSKVEEKPTEEKKEEKVEKEVAKPEKKEEKEKKPEKEEKPTEKEEKPEKKEKEEKPVEKKKE